MKELLIKQIIDEELCKVQEQLWLSHDQVLFTIQQLRETYPNVYTEEQWNKIAKEILEL